MGAINYIYNDIEQYYGGKFKEIQCTDPRIKKIVLEIPKEKYRSFHYWDKRVDTGKTLDSIKISLSTAFLAERNFQYSRVK